jgi:hypothetical protein
VWSTQKEKKKKKLGGSFSQNNLFVYIHIGFMVYVEEKVRKQTINSIPRMIN